MKSTKQKTAIDRRAFLNGLGTTAGIAASLPAISILSEAATAYADDIGPQGGLARAETSERIRQGVAERESSVRIPNHEDNGDEALYPSKIGNYSKNLKHDSTTGEVDPAAYEAMIAAISTGRFADFEALATNGHFGSADKTVQRRLVNPGSGYAFDLEGTDSHQLKLAPAPAFASAQEAGEMAELYWMALLRDVNFADYETNSLAQAAAADLSKMSDFRGPKAGGEVTPQTLFRDTYPGCTVGPYISQFLLQPCNFGSMRIDSRMVTVAPNADYMTTFPAWLSVQNGVNTPPIPTGDLAYCRSGRDLTHYVNIDQLFEAYFVACINLLSSGYLANLGNPYGRIYDGGAGRPLNPILDPNGSLAQVGFGTFGGPAVLTLACEPATRALKDVWYQKWLVHRRLRPEEFGGRVEVKRLGLANYPIHNDLLSVSSVLSSVLSKFGTGLLPMAFPEGSPNHTSYGSGHATVAGACVTMLKALFDDTQLVKNPVVPNPADGGQTLIPYAAPAGEPPLTVGGELNKVVSNVSQGRNMAGVHWRSDATASNALGEAATISMLQDMKRTFSEPFAGFTFTKFDGTTVTV
ncbi:MAG TPA: vanadium-dependent haloperoxidase [Candidatus Acidoferrales bacterium]|nr:vanadium-dependent haloperoxidase [Candidatus Acidoferrales bacterium]